ncbi:MAG TPA: hypothetical protein VGM51_00400 [Armatimonadota bacterium]|jgi:hypothetical protein
MCSRFFPQPWTVVPVLLLGIIPIRIEAQTPQWKRVSLTGPRSRDGSAMAYDIARGRTVLFGGHYYDTAHRYLSDTWEWDGTTWTQVASTGPPARSDLAMAYDSARHKVVLYGGSFYDTANRYLNDTWEWDGSVWKQVAVTGPGQRAEHSMAYHPGRGKVILFSGTSASASQLADTWEFNGTAWAQLPPTGPSARLRSAMVYDSIRGRLVVFGGYHYSTAWTDLDDTWEWAPASGWTAKYPSSSPPARKAHAMVYDSARGKTVLYGGSASTSLLGDTWEYDGTTWTEVNVTGPYQRHGHAMAFDSARQTVVLFGPGNDTWEYSVVVAPYTLTDVQQAIRAAGGKIALTAELKARLNLVTTGASATRVDLADAERIARKVTGLEPNP